MRVRAARDPGLPWRDRARQTRARARLSAASQSVGGTQEVASALSYPLGGFVMAVTLSQARALLIARPPDSSRERAMTSAASTPRLRLVGAEELPPATSPRDLRSAGAEVARENHSAGRNAALDPGDPRWKLAVAAYSKLTGTTLTPERRAQVMKTARVLGVRPFEANVIIAIIQDHARTGRSLPEAAGTIGLINKPSGATGAGLWRWAAALTAAAILNALLIWWLLAAR